MKPNMTGLNHTGFGASSRASRASARVRVTWDALRLLTSFAAAAIPTSLSGNRRGPADIPVPTKGAGDTKMDPGG
ncbi:hypothetical protein GCM10009768_03640 [Leucobacter iarius]|uniref:Uncharacterized protein n=1 Tax=Leucobacter iarius TaxID=333963 RepID=A0ABN2L885_9MICO